MTKPLPARTLVNISWCAGHWKGANPGEGQRLHGQTHAEWLEAAVDWYRRRGWPVIVSATEYRGILDVNNSAGDCERDVLWRLIAAKVPILGAAINPGHQVGAALTIRMGLEYAAHCGYDYLVHTAEDILPLQGRLAQAVIQLDEGASYAGERWGMPRDELNAQFFACRVQALVGPWDACAVSGYGCIERYLRVLVGEQPCAFLDSPVYRHTHDFAEWRRWKHEQEKV